MKKLLIVEDDINLAELYKEAFAKEGFEVRLALDGVEALAKAEHFVPDIILLDLMLPQIDGFEVLAKIKANPLTVNSLVIVQTNLDSEMQRQKAKNLGADEFLVKSDSDPGKLISEAKKLISPN